MAHSGLGRWLCSGARGWADWGAEALLTGFKGAMSLGLQRGYEFAVASCALSEGGGEPMGHEAFWQSFLRSHQTAVLPSYPPFLPGSRLSRCASSWAPRAASWAPARRAGRRRAGW